jgi:hypothetical protein
VALRATLVFPDVLTTDDSLFVRVPFLQILSLRRVIIRSISSRASRGSQNVEQTRAILVVTTGTDVWRSSTETATSHKTTTFQLARAQLQAVLGSHAEADATLATLSDGLLLWS